jgi:hypothetical protein
LARLPATGNTSSVIAAISSPNVVLICFFPRMITAPRVACVSPVYFDDGSKTATTMPGTDNWNFPFNHFLIATWSSV